MIGILTEKPSAARNFAKALGAQKTGDHYSGSFHGESFVIVHSVGSMDYLTQNTRYQNPLLHLTQAGIFPICHGTNQFFRGKKVLFLKQKMSLLR